MHIYIYIDRYTSIFAHEGLLIEERVAALPTLVRGGRQALSTQKKNVHGVESLDGNSSFFRTAA